MADKQDHTHRVRVGRNLKVVRELSGYRPGELAAAITPRPITARTIHYIERGDKALTPVMAGKIAKVLGVDPRSLLSPPDEDEEPELAVAS